MKKRYRTKEDVSKINEDIVVAIKVIQEGGQKVSAEAIKELTGHTQFYVYSCPAFRPFVRSPKFHNRPNRGKNNKEVEVSPPDVIEIQQEIAAYKTHITENYFTRPERVQEVRDEMMLRVKDFMPSLFHQAINLLKLEHVLVESQAEKNVLYLKRPAEVEQLVGRYEQMKQSHELQRLSAESATLDVEPAKQILEGAEEDGVQAEQSKEVAELHQRIKELEEQLKAKPIPQSVAKSDVPEAEPFEKYFQMPLSRGKLFKMTFPSDISAEDKEDISDYLQIVLKRTLKH